MASRNVSYIYHYVEDRYDGEFVENNCLDPNIKKIVLTVPQFQHRSFHYWDRRFDTSKTLEAVKALLATAFLNTVERTYSRVK